MYPGCLHGTCDGEPWKCYCLKGWGGGLCDLGEFLPLLSDSSVNYPWLAQLLEHQTAKREVAGSSPRPDRHLGSKNN